MNNIAPLTLNNYVTLAAARRLPLLSMIGIAEDLKARGQANSAAELYKTWIAFNGDDPFVYIAYFNYGAALRELDDIAGAINALRECLRVKPLFGPAQINLGRAFEDSGHIVQALEQWEDLVAGGPAITGEGVAHKLMALQHIGRVLENTERLVRAEEALQQAMELRPDKTEAGQHLIALRQRQCKWPTIVPSQFVSFENYLAAMSPMSAAAFIDDPMFQLAKAYRYNKCWVGRPEGAPFTPRIEGERLRGGRRLRIGYVSSDLREHAVGFALVEIFEHHDRNKLEIFAYYCGDSRPLDDTQARIRSFVDHWREIASLTDLAAARMIADDRIDILIDLNGYTKSARTGIFAYRPAPVIVNWCGYPGTMGSSYHNYLIADAQIIPPESEIFYSEKILRIPCNQPIDRKRKIAERTVSREQAGLPEDLFVFASFNGMQKITQACWRRWMSILTAAPQSVLWLLEGDEATNSRLRRAAEEAGVDQGRIIFAAKAPNPEHLARIPLADLFLDTFPYGAHSTAADALTMGLPVLTIPGKSFASRFCSSVVRAAGLDELICATEEDYIARAHELAHAPEQLRSYREKLAQERQTSVLFDIPTTVRMLESLYFEMQENCERGATPIPDLTNLDAYYEVGLSLAEQNLEMMGPAEHRLYYAEKLASLHEHSPLPADKRFWPGPEAM
jgi:predicted O-linked N-acetylglucosamine transferase (SPINDLY family)